MNAFPAVKKTSKEPLLFDATHVHNNRLRACCWQTNRLFSSPKSFSSLEKARLLTDDLFHTVQLSMLQRLQPLTVPFRSILQIVPLSVPAWTKENLQSVLKNPVMHLETLHETQRPFQEILCTQKNLQEKFDLILCPLQLHWCNDPRLFLYGLHQCLKPGGLMLCNFWGGDTLARLRHALAALDFEVLGQTPPRISPMIPLNQAAALLSATEFKLGVVDEDFFFFPYANLEELVWHLRLMGENAAPGSEKNPALLPSHYRRLKTTWGKDCVSAASDAATREKFHLITLTGWRDGPSIPKPLQRGSAQKDLKDALEIR